jgi:hypothetical protein
MTSQSPNSMQCYQLIKIKINFSMELLLLVTAITIQNHKKNMYYCVTSGRILHGLEGMCETVG